jgi:hypothetical protein
MIRYTSQNQLSLASFQHPFGHELDQENRWVLLAEQVPWDDLAAAYSRKLKSNKGRLSVDIRKVIAALIIKHKMNLDERGTILMIQENVYMQYFCGLQQFTTKRIFDPSLFGDIRKRFGREEYEEFIRLVNDSTAKMKPIRKRKTKTDSDAASQHSYGNIIAWMPRWIRKR